MREQTFLSVKDQDNIRQKITKLAWLGERYGDTAKYQGFDQAEILSEIISLTCLLRLLFVARFND